MTLSLSVLVVLAVAALLMCRKGELKVWHAIVCALFGFYLASTSVAPTVRQGTSAVAEFISSIKI
ncbi:hypothetical protein ABH926_005204 [Catenulispora sp. GP43]|uniref:hypothetical protein n=1 Tax=Catenulispora sp. GP43 TaxID=3156263 RepID=UPI00351471AB